MIVSIKGAFAEAVVAGKAAKGFPPDILRSVERKLAMIEAATVLGDLRSPPGNRLEALHGDRNGQHAIRIDDPWRVCFSWTSLGAEDVEIVDYR